MIFHNKCIYISSKSSDKYVCLRATWHHRCNSSVDGDGGGGKKRYLLHADLLSKRLLQCYIQHVISTPAFRWQQSIFAVQTPSLRSHNSQINRSSDSEYNISAWSIQDSNIFWARTESFLRAWNIKTESSFGLFSSGAKFLYKCFCVNDKINSKRKKKIYCKKWNSGIAATLKIFRRFF